MMSRDDCHKIAATLSNLRPRRSADDAPESRLWLDLVDQIGDHVPQRYQRAFGASCTNGGAWQGQYEEPR